MRSGIWLALVVPLLAPIGLWAQEKEEGKQPTIEVPYVPTPQEVVEEMLKLAEVKEGDVVYDLGCGDGRIVITAVKKYGAKRGVGIDLNEERIADSNRKAKEAGVTDKVEFRQGDVLYIKDFSEADVVTLYMLTPVNILLKPILKKSLKPGSRVVSHAFKMGDDWEPEKTVEVMCDDGVKRMIYLWRIPEKED